MTTRLPGLARAFAARVEPPASHREVGRHDVRGFTLVEVLLAMLILSVAILGLMTTLLQAGRTGSDGQRLSEAAALAQLRLEEAVIAPADHPPPPNGREGLFAWRLDLSDKPHGLRLAEVEVSWSDRGRPKVFRVGQLFLRRDSHANAEGGS